MAKLRRKYNDLSLRDESTDLESTNQSQDPLSIGESELVESIPISRSERSDAILSRDEIQKDEILVREIIDIDTNYMEDDENNSEKSKKSDEKNNSEGNDQESENNDDEFNPIMLY